MTKPSEKTVRNSIVIGGILALMLAVVQTPLLASEKKSFVGWYEPAKPTEWSSKYFKLSAGKSIKLRLSNGVPLEAYGPVAPWLSLIGYVISPKGAARSTIFYVYSSDALKAAGSKILETESIHRSAIVFPNQMGAYTSYFLNADVDAVMAAQGLRAEMINAIFHNTADWVAEKYGETGTGFFATDKKLKGIPIAAKLSASTNAWMMIEEGAHPEQ